ncbi:MAG: outer membrane beta-barrel protein [Prevotellaceae bacterium]|jgi:hypothetical protein|nr:outer membrane beta-barrel protein [Prevotellaceae bacterium]
MTTVSAFSQTKNIVVSGRIMEGDTNQPAVQANIQLLSLPDSTFVTGIASSTNGNFTLPAVPAGRYVMKTTYIGYLPNLTPLQLTESRTAYNVGTVTMKVDAVLLSEVAVTAAAPQVSVSADSLIFNASAYRTPEGAMLEELVRKIPGAEIDESGNVKINGKDITKLLVNGKEFFGGDISTGLKNLPVDMVEKLKTYERQSDNARITGIDDGEEEQVLDLTVKKGMNQGWFGNADAAVGTEDRFSSRLMVNRFNDNQQLTIMGSANNTGNQGFFGGGGGARFGSNMGLSTPKMGGASFAFENDKLQLGGSLRYNGNRSDIQNRTATENSDVSAIYFSNSNSTQLNRNHSVNAQIRLEWKIDSLTTFLFRPNFSWREQDNLSNSNNGSFNGNPLDLVDNPNDYLDLGALANDPLQAIRVNTSNRGSRSDGDNISANASFQLNRRLSDNGRNISLEGDFSYGNNKSNQYTENTMRFQYMPNDSINNTYVTTPTKNISYELELSYSEPLAPSTYLQFRYQFEYSRSESDRRTYDMDLADANWNIDAPLPPSYPTYLVDSLGQYAKYDNYNHQASVSLLFNKTNYRLSAGLDFRPQSSRMSYVKNRLDTVVTRNVFNFAPNIDFRYRFSNTTQLRFNYRGRPSQPSMENLLDVTDYSNPLSIRKGNPGLKPSFAHSARFNFDTYNAERQQGIFSNFNFTATQNSISNSTQYDHATGVSTIRPMNINGNWNVFGMFGFTSALKNKNFTVGTFSNASYNNNVNYLFDRTIMADLKNTSTTLTLSERINGAYRNSWFEFGLNGSINYSFQKNKLQPQLDMEPYTFAIGANTQFMMPWGMTFTTNMTNQARRGYSDPSMNRNEWIWNAQLSQTFLKGSATVTLEAYDILKQQLNISNQYNNGVKTTTQYNAINNYFMVHFVYRLNIFGGGGRGQQDGPGGFRGPGGTPPTGGYGAPPAGFRPGGMGGGMGGGMRR